MYILSIGALISSSNVFIAVDERKQNWFSIIEFSLNTLVLQKKKVNRTQGVIYMRKSCIDLVN